MSNKENLIFHLLEIPLKRPIVTAWGNMMTKPVIVVEAVNNTHTAYGEIPCLPSGKYTSKSAYELYAIIKEEICPIRKSEEDLLQALSTLNLPEIELGITAASLTLKAKSQEKDLHQYFSIAERKVDISKVYGAKFSIDEILENIASKKFKQIKVKLKNRRDIPLLFPLQQLESSIQIVIDCNQCLDSNDEVNKIWEMLPNCMIEEPFSVQRIDEYRKINTPEKIIFDESSTSTENILSLANKFPNATFSIKPFRFGSLEKLKDITDRDIRCTLGGMYETGIGRSFNLFLAALLGITQSCEISERGTYFVNEITDDNHFVVNGAMSSCNSFTINQTHWDQYLIESVS